MGHGEVAGAVKIRGNPNADVYLVINSDGSINVVVAGLAELTLGANTVVSVSNAETVVLAANANRKGAVIQNHAASVLQLHFTAGQVFGAGPIEIPQYSSIEVQQDGGVYRGTVYGIRAVATGNAGVVEET